jgi:hypothetical protein
LKIDAGLGSDINSGGYAICGGNMTYGAHPFKGVGTTCASVDCRRCSWISDLPSVLTVTLSDCVDNAYGTDFATMNGAYSLVLEMREVLSSSGYAHYVSTLEPAAPKLVDAYIECNSSGFVRYKAGARTQKIYGAGGNVSGPFIDSTNKCFTTSFPGGNPAFVSCNFVVSCVTPLP